MKTLQETVDNMLMVVEKRTAADAKRIKDLEHAYSNAIYDLEQAEKFLQAKTDAAYDEGYEDGFAAGMENS